MVHGTQRTRLKPTTLCGAGRGCLFQATPIHVSKRPLGKRLGSSLAAPRVCTSAAPQQGSNRPQKAATFATPTRGT
eukprot:3885930-Alexandrium_andersonii.AAC.1